MKKKLFGAFALLALVAAPALAEAATQGFSTANVNMRSGPSTAYPAVVVIPNGEPLTIHGCLSDTPWCDVSFSYGRGWVAGRYVQAIYRQNRVYVEPRYYRDLGVPIITFEAGRYWDQNYRNRDFYRDRDRWRRPPPSGGYWNAPPPRDFGGPPPRPRDDWRGRDDRRDRGPNDGRWEQRHGDWNQNDRQRPPMRDRDNDRQRWDNDNRDRDRDRNRDRDNNRDRNRDMNQNDPRRQNDEGRGRPDGNRPPPPQQQQGGPPSACMLGAPGCEIAR
ncbi:SH3 domain-containing protein [Agrobacterium rosae]|uniref:SH3 domain-containing protein n=1 Tax=Agrobacterium rosae TaxID=1972867 RepID=A0AAW9FLB9_9HYPH|nr:SH3 domain-containing protein [Agrobacterium rosae]MDX8305367.1 SH3 domain-containing protein [Agrobacterium rosae]